VGRLSVFDPKTSRAPKKTKRFGHTFRTQIRVCAIGEMAQISMAHLAKPGPDRGQFSRATIKPTRLAVLFSGPPGTGKTIAAEVIAADLQADLVRIDLATVVSKRIGETSKNLNRIFRAGGASLGHAAVRR